MNIENAKCSVLISKMAFMVVILKDQLKAPPEPYPGLNRHMAEGMGQHDRQGDNIRVKSCRILSKIFRRSTSSSEFSLCWKQIHVI